MKRLFWGATLTAVMAFSLAACGEALWNGPQGKACTEIAVAGVTVYVEELETGVSVCDASVTLTGTDGHRETLESFGTGETDCSYSGAWERPGTYTIEVQREGFDTYRSEPLVVRRTSDGCHVEPVLLEIGLRASE